MIVKTVPWALPLILAPTVKGQGPTCPTFIRLGNQPLSCKNALKSDRQFQVVGDFVIRKI